MKPQQNSTGPLAGLKVADFGWQLASPMTTQLLAAFGATVIRVESKVRIDTVRTSRPYKDRKPGINRSAYFALANANKLSMALDLANPKGLGLAKRLVKWADVVSENWIPGAFERRGLGYEEIRKVNPQIVMISMSMHGQTGPDRRHLGYGHALVALEGFTQITGWPDLLPAQPYGSYTDWVVPSFGVLAIMSALDYRRRTGRGQYIDLSQNEAGLQLLSPIILDYFANGNVAGRMGNYCAYAAPHGAYRCKGDDRWCTVAVFTDGQWRSLRRLMGNPAWADDRRFATLLDRKENEEELNRLVEVWTVNFTAEDLMSLLQKADIPSGVVKNNADIVADPQLCHREHFWRIKHPEIGNTLHLGAPFRLSATPGQPRSPAPCVGEHTEYVCREILGMSDDEFVTLLNEGVFE